MITFGNYCLIADIKRHWRRELKLRSACHACDVGRAAVLRPVCSSTAVGGSRFKADLPQIFECCAGIWAGQCAARADKEREKNCAHGPAGAANGGSCVPRQIYALRRARRLSRLAVKIFVSAAAVTYMLRRGSPAPLNAFAAVVRQDVDGIALMADLRALYVKNFLRNGAAYCVRPGYVRTYVPFNGRRHCARRNLK